MNKPLDIAGSLVYNKKSGFETEIVLKKHADQSEARRGDRKKPKNEAVGIVFADGKVG